MELGWGLCPRRWLVIFVFDGIFYRRGREVRERQYVAPLWLQKRTQLAGLNEGGFIKTFHIKENKDMNK